jgi:hypothetical protein
MQAIFHARGATLMFVQRGTHHRRAINGHRSVATLTGTAFRMTSGPIA